jgi:regulator of sigma D
MLTMLEKIRKQVAGRDPAIDAWLAVRRNLLIEYMKVANLMPANKITSARRKALAALCDHLVDYISAGHFEIYEILIDAYEKAQGRHLTLSNRIINRILDTTDEILDFNERYISIEDDELPELTTDLSHLGMILEERFKLEDKLVLVLDIFDANHVEDNAKRVNTA